MIYYIYKITVGDFLYIGSTKDVDARWSSHIRKSIGEYKAKHTSVNEAIKAYGYENCKFEIINEINTEDRTIVFTAEQAEINKYDKVILLNDQRAKRTIEDIRAADRLRTQKPERKEYHNTLEKRLRAEMKINEPEKYKEYLEKQRQRKSEYQKQVDTDPIKRELYLQKQREYNARRPKRKIK